MTLKQKDSAQGSEESQEVLLCFLLGKPCHTITYCRSIYLFPKEESKALLAKRSR